MYVRKEKTYLETRLIRSRRIYENWGVKCHPFHTLSDRLTNCRQKDEHYTLVYLKRRKVFGVGLNEVHL